MIAFHVDKFRGGKAVIRMMVDILKRRILNAYSY
jgi:hypothetical protein